jgi:ABC-type polar amino acid transport system ATPase subunit
MIYRDNLTKYLGERQVLRDSALTLNPGETNVINGKSGTRQ